MPYIEIINPFWVDFCVWCKIKIQFYSFVCGYPTFSLPLLEHTSLSLVCIFGTLFIFQRFLDYICTGSFWTVYSVPLFYVSFLLLLLSSPEHMHIDFRARRGGKEGVKKRERKKYRCERESWIGCLLRAPRLGLNPPSRHVTWLRIKPVTFRFMRHHSDQLRHTGHGSPCLSLCQYHTSFITIAFQYT